MAAPFCSGCAKSIIVESKNDSIILWGETKRVGKWLKLICKTGLLVTNVR